MDNLSDCKTQGDVLASASDYEERLEATRDLLPESAMSDNTKAMLIDGYNKLATDYYDVDRFVDALHRLDASYTENDTNSIYCEACKCRITIGRCEHGVMSPSFVRAKAMHDALPESTKRQLVGPTPSQIFLRTR